MGLSARTDDLDGSKVGEGYIMMATSAGNKLIFKDPSNANIYRRGNAAQFARANGDTTGGFNTETALG